MQSQHTAFATRIGLVEVKQPVHMLNKHACALCFRHHVSKLVIRAHVNKLNRTIAHIITTRIARSQVDVLRARMTCIVFAE